MIVFPEVATHGYTSFDWFLDKDIINASKNRWKKSFPRPKGITAIVGTIRPNTENDGRRFLIRRPSFTTENCSDTPTKRFCPNTTFSTTRVISSRRRAENV
jgi:predicted amidohydrolase